jgi:hypothetical protein
VFISMVTLYKHGPQVRYLVEKMSDSEKHLLDVVTKLSEKIDAYDRRLTSMGSDIAKVHSQVDLSMKLIQVLQKEQVLLQQPVTNPVSSGRPGPVRGSGVMGSSPSLSGSPSSAMLPYQSPVPPSSSHAGDAVPIITGVHHNGDKDSNHRKPWMAKMDFPCFDGSDVHIWLDKCYAYFQLYGIPSDFRVMAASLHMVGRASHLYQSYKHSVGNHT